MPAKTASPAAADFRPQLRQAYLIAFDSFAVGVGEIRDTLGVDVKMARKILDHLERNGVLVSEIVSGEKERIWQAAETYDHVSRSTAIRRFDAAYPKGEAVEIAKPKTNGRKGATGPRYTDAQLKTGLAARKAGKKHAEVAAAAGVKSPNYFAKTLKAIEATLAAASKAGKSATGSGVKKGDRASKPSRTVKVVRTAKKATR